MCFNSTTKFNVRICSVPGCNNITHHKQLVCDEHLGLHVNPKDFTRDDQTVVTLDSKSTSALNRIHEIMHPRTWNKISHERFNKDLNDAVTVISLRTGISSDSILKYASEKRKNYCERNYENGREMWFRGENVDWRNS